MALYLNYNNGDVTINTYKLSGAYASDLASIIIAYDELKGIKLSHHLEPEELSWGFIEQTVDYFAIQYSDYADYREYLAEYCNA